MLRKLDRAGMRGRVRIVLASKNDHGAAIWASRFTYAGLLRKRVHIYEYQPTKLHTKLFLIGDVVYIGSANYDIRSLFLNLEMMLRIEDHGFAAHVRRLAEPYWVDGESLLLGCSLGIAHSQAQPEADPLMWHAHIAMRQAKSMQGCTYHLFDERINRNARSLADLEGELRRALRRDELELHYQPRLCLDSGRIVGLEALVRWRHQERGLLPPSEFVPLAEQSGLIVPLGYWVIFRALRDMQALREQGFAPLHMAINLSFRQFQDSQLLPTLNRLIAEHDVDARWLEFELTETAVMRRSDQVRQTMDALRQLGVRFSLDDFGTGYSSFMHLNSLPIALLKIDMGFVAQMELREENRKLVNAMINLAHNLNLEVVAEGVETGGQLELLRSFGCNQVQGYLISRPLPVEELVTYLRSQAVHADTSRSG